MSTSVRYIVLNRRLALRMPADETPISLFSSKIYYERKIVEKL